MRIVADTANLGALRRVERIMTANTDEQPASLADRVRREFACRRCGYGITVFVSRLPRCPMCGSASWRERLS